MDEEKRYTFTIDELNYYKGQHFRTILQVRDFLEAHAQPTCCIEGYHEDSSGVSWLLSCDHDVDGYTKPCYCSVCGARVVDTVLGGEQE